MQLNASKIIYFLSEFFLFLMLKYIFSGKGFQTAIIVGLKKISQTK